MLGVWYYVICVCDSIGRLFPCLGIHYLSLCVFLFRVRVRICVYECLRKYMCLLCVMLSHAALKIFFFFFLFFFWYYGISHDSTRYIYIYISISIYHMLHIRVTYIRRLYALKMSQRRPENDSSTETHNRIKIIECRTLPMITYILVVFE